jgi:hypothetical protein
VEIRLQAAKRRGLDLVSWLRDLYPGSCRSAGSARRGLLQLREALLRAAHANVVARERMAVLVRKRGIAATYPRHAELVR